MVKHARKAIYVRIKSQTDILRSSIEIKPDGILFEIQKHRLKPWFFYFKQHFSISNFILQLTQKTQILKTQMINLELETVYILVKKGDRKNKHISI